jgi:hypothetical protein
MLIVLLVAAVQVKDFLVPELTMCQDFPNITIASDRSYELLIQMSALKVDDQTYDSQVCLIPDPSDPTIRGIVLEVQDTKVWKDVTAGTFINIPKGDPTRKEFMFSANNTFDKGAFSNFSNVATALKRSIYNMEFPRFAEPYNSLVNKDNSVAK